ncbi:MAG TPA: methylthioribulose 1-phosphate dehydratase [Actinomycetota bacterium]|nr:methylthioribulose 1-phosphate dehydratase [Actinomycetota bacterium]
MTDQETKALLCELLRVFYDKNWVSGTGGGICGPTEDGNLFLAPTGVHKERVKPEDFFVVSPGDGSVVTPAGDPSLRPSECNSIFCTVARARGARSVVHSHALSAVLAAEFAGTGRNLLLSGFEMLKGIRGVSNTDVHVVPLILNRPRESQLTDQIEQVLADPKLGSSFCILVKDHGAYIWGDDVWEAKRHTEVYHWLFEAVVARAHHTALAENEPNTRS